MGTQGYVVTDSDELDSYIGSGEIGPQNSKALVLFTSVDPRMLTGELDGDSMMYVYVEKKVKAGVYKVLNCDS